GMAVDAVHDGAAALEAAAQTAYDVIVLDRDLPVVHGDRVCRIVAGSGPRIPMLTAAGEVEDPHDGSGLGLTIVASIAAIHGGTAIARPRNDGGLSVTVTIPSAQDTRRSGSYH